MTKDEALKLALEALQFDSFYGTGKQEAITAIEAALEAKDEPFEYWNAVEGWVKIDEVRQHFDSVGCGTIYKTAGEDRTPLYTTPPQRKPLTEEKFKHMPELFVVPPHHVEMVVRAIEAAHGIKGAS